MGRKPTRKGGQDRPATCVIVPNFEFEPSDGEGEEDFEGYPQVSVQVVWAGFHKASARIVCLHTHSNAHQAGRHPVLRHLLMRVTPRQTRLTVTTQTEQPACRCNVRALHDVSLLVTWMVCRCYFHRNVITKSSAVCMMHHAAVTYRASPSSTTRTSHLLSSVSLASRRESCAHFAIARDIHM
jgi:hypothetical protein